LGGEVWWLWGFLVIAISYNLATNHWAMAVQGLNRMRDLQLSYVMSGVSYVACAAVMLTCRMGLASMVVAYFVAGWVLRWNCRRVYREMVPKPEHPAAADPQIVRKLWPNACKFGVLGIGGFCLANGNVLICRQFLGIEATNSFGLTAKLAGFITGFAGLWLNVKWPEIAILRSQGRQEEMAKLFARRLTLVMLSVIGMDLMLLFGGNALLGWKGSSTHLIPAPILAVYLAYLGQQVFCSQFGTLAYTENVMPFFKIALSTGLGVIACSLILTPLFGLWGLVTAPLLVEMAYSSWFTVRRGFQGQPLSVRRFCRAMLS
jgi:O-antigen/teichoic acid export membrane protein